MILCGFFFCKIKKAYEMRSSDWSSDVCSSDLFRETNDRRRFAQHYGCALGTAERHPWVGEIAGAPRIVPVKEGSLDGDEASFIMKAAVVKSRNHGGPELDVVALA